MIAKLWDFISRWFKPPKKSKPRKKYALVKTSESTKKKVIKRAPKAAVQCKKKDSDGL